MLLGSITSGHVRSNKKSFRRGWIGSQYWEGYEVVQGKWATSEEELGARQAILGFLTWYEGGYAMIMG